MQEAAALLHRLALVARGEGSLAGWLGLDARALARVAALGLAQLRAGQAASAVRVLSGLVALEPRVALFHAQLGAACSQAGETERALAAYDQAIALSDRGEARAELQLSRAAARALAGDRPGAEVDLRQARAALSGAALRRAELLALRLGVKP